MNIALVPRAILFADGEDAKRVVASINTFFCWGYFDHEERNYYGMRYSRLTINQRGKQALVQSQPEVASV